MFEGPLAIPAGCFMGSPAVWVESLAGVVKSADLFHDLLEFQPFFTIPGRGEVKILRDSHHHNSNVQ